MTDESIGDPHPSTSTASFDPTRCESSYSHVRLQLSMLSDLLCALAHYITCKCRYEAGGVAFHSQANSLAIPPSNGHHLTLEDVDANLVRGDDIHGAPTRIVALENTLSGTVFPQDEIVRISDAMRKEGVIMHCDGARMWEVVAKSGSTLKELCDPFDTVSLCMSKGLGAPIGS